MDSISKKFEAAFNGRRFLTTPPPQEEPIAHPDQPDSSSMSAERAIALVNESQLATGDPLADYFAGNHPQRANPLQMMEPVDRLLFESQMRQQRNEQRSSALKAWCAEQNKLVE